MSHEATAWAIRQILPTGPKLVLILLADHHNKITNKVCPRQAVLAEDAGMARQTVNRSITKLVEFGLVSIVENFRDDGGRRSNDYVLHLDVDVAKRDTPLSQFETTPLSDCDTPLSQNATPPVSNCDSKNLEVEPVQKDPPKKVPTNQTEVAPKTETLPSHGEVEDDGPAKIPDKRDPPGKAGELAATVRAIYLEVCAVPVWYPSAKHRDAEWLETWAGQGFLPEDLNRVFRRVLAETSSAKPATLSYFEQPMARYATEFAWDLAYNLRPPQTEAEIADLEAERAARKAADEEASRRNHEALVANLKAAAGREKAKRDKEFAE